MKRLFTIATIVLTACIAYAGHRDKVTYTFPENMSDAVKTEFIKQCDKGAVLYEINCAKCHNTTVGRKEIIPDFAPEQLIGYELRVKNPKHESNIPETTVTAEELGQIMTFLTYKTKNK